VQLHQPPGRVVDVDQQRAARSAVLEPGMLAAVDLDQLAQAGAAKARLVGLRGPLVAREPNPSSKENLAESIGSSSGISIRVNLSDKTHLRKPARPGSTGAATRLRLEPTGENLRRVSTEVFTCSPRYQAVWFTDAAHFRTFLVPPPRSSLHGRPLRAPLRRWLAVGTVAQPMGSRQTRGSPRTGREADKPMPAGWGLA